MWPLSRDKRPKQALRLAGEQSMFQQAVERLDPLFPPEQIFVVTRSEHAPLLREQAPEVPPENFILEPEGRGTAPAIGLAAIHLQKRDPEAGMAVLTADHFIADTAGFQRVLEAGMAAARQDYLMTLGIQPTSPSTGYGYIEMGEKLIDHGGIPVQRVKRFVEKPDLERAVAMVTSGEYAWNSGMFLWRVGRILEEFRLQMPDFFARLQEVADVLGTPEYEKTLAEAWPKVAKQTIDYGVMEHAGQAAVIPANIGWVDVGSWGSLNQVLSADENGNIWTGPHVDIDTRNTLVFLERPRLVATIGVEALVIVDTEDALLICTKDREQDVRAVVQQLQETGRGQWL
jgi:mannose-1-phosphate guanylyltransferase